MDFLHTMLRVRSLDDSLRFFCEGLGLQEVRRVDHEAGRFTLVFLAAVNDVERAGLSGDEKGFVAGLPMLELTHNWPAEGGGGSEGLGDEVYTQGRNFGHVAFRTSNIYARCQHLIDMGYEINRPPRDGYMAFVRSPDGISVELLQSGKPLEPRTPWKDMDNTGSW
jgi:lactoylglutathione lyase